MSLLIVEGPDGAGKTTLIERISELTHVHAVHHHGAYPDEEFIMNHYLDSMTQALTAPEGLVIMDRSWIAEPIYGDAMRDGVNRISGRQEKILKCVAVSCNVVVILCLPPFEVCVDNWARRLQDEYPQKNQQLRDIYVGYENWWKAMKMNPPGTVPVIKYDYTESPEARLLGLVYLFQSIRAQL
jgi:hypothetical protein